MPYTTPPTIRTYLPTNYIYGSLVYVATITNSEVNESRRLRQLYQLEIIPSRCCRISSTIDVTKSVGINIFFIVISYTNHFSCIFHIILIILLLLLSD